MRNFIVINFLLFIVVVSFNSQADEVFSQAEVQANIERYIEDVFGKKKPTLRIYAKYEGMKNPKESKLEKLECQRISKDGAASNQSNKDCNNWLAGRYRNMESSESLYYRELRRAVSINSKNIFITGISRSNEPASAYKIEAIDKNTNVSLEFFHAYNKFYASIGKLGLMKVNGVDVKEIIPGLMNKNSKLHRDCLNKEDNRADVRKY